MKTMKPGTRVKMSEGLKRKLGGECRRRGHHVGPFMRDYGTCMGCSWEHLQEFENCAGVVEGHVTGPRGERWPEVNVRWAPSNLRYGYSPDDLVEVQ